AGAGGDILGRAGALVRGSIEKLAQRAEEWKKVLGTRLQPADGAAGLPSTGLTPAGQTGRGDGAAVAPKSEAAVSKAEMTRAEALQALGLEPGATASQVEAAYRARARQNGSLNGSEKLSQARDILRGERS
ncbi:MAG: hypothetical protein J2P50_20570, partial [Hyphomicrobiaceae bacterium]|nr:hypothetical protein [Hyphomicrobiaceae bacterium]